MPDMSKRELLYAVLHELRAVHAKVDAVLEQLNTYSFSAEPAAQDEQEKLLLILPGCAL